jgi:hypothetical protein
MGLDGIMSKRPLLSVLCAGCIVFLSTSSWAATSATVDPSKGVVLVNRGKGFSQIKQPAKVKVGNSVMVGPEGAAIIAYADGCTVDVKPGTVETVGALSPCASGASAENNQDYSYHWCVTPAAPTDYGNPSYCAGVPVTAAAFAVFGAVIYEALSP